MMWDGKKSLAQSILKEVSTLKSIRVHLVLRFCTVSWSYFDEF